jgi:5-formyltetrahydrofolate cyclo-ligase
MDEQQEDLLRRRVKAELRKRMRALRNTTPASAIAERSARIVAALEVHDAVKAARAVALFWPIEERHEVDLRALDASLRARGVRVAYPGVDPETRDMAFRFVEHTDRMKEQGFGFREPPMSEPEAGARDLDVVVVPALAIDPVGYRIGYGAGYYDRTLPRFCPPGVAIGVAFDFQLLAEVPATPSDVRVAWIVTDARTLAATRDPST